MSEAKIDKIEKMIKPEVEQGVNPTKLPLSGFTIFVRVGHWNQNSPGAISPHDGTKEVDINMLNAKELIPMLQKAGAKIRGTKEKMSTREMALYSRTMELDMVLDLHCNSWSDDRPKGTLCFYHSTKGEKLAGLVQNAIAAHTGISKNFNQKCNHYMVGLTKPVAVIIEYAFISNESDKNHLLDPDWRTKANEGIVEAVIEYKEGLK